MGIVESSQHFPKVPAEAVVQRICSYASRFQQLIEIVMSEEKKYSVRNTQLADHLYWTGPLLCVSEDITSHEGVPSNRFGSGILTYGHSQFLFSPSFIIASATFLSHAKKTKDLSDCFIHWRLSCQLTGLHGGHFFPWVIMFTVVCERNKVTFYRPGLPQTSEICLFLPYECLD